MEALFPDWLVHNTGDLDAIFSAGGLKLKLTILVKNPLFGSSFGAQGGTPGASNTAHITSISTLAALLADPAWQDVLSVNSNHNYPFQDWPVAQQTNNVSFTDAAPTFVRHVNVSASEFDYWPNNVDPSPCIATGFVLSLVGGTNDGKIVMIFRPDTPIFLTGESASVCSRILTTDYFFWYVENNATGSAADGWNIQPGSISIVVPAANWETSRCAHVWIDPQRINYVINPSFRTGPSSYPLGWRTNATTSAQVSGGINRIDLMSFDTSDGPADVAGTEAQAQCLHLIGPPGYVRLDGSAGARIVGPDIAALAGAKALTIEVDCSLDDWTPAVAMQLVGQFGTPSFAWRLYITNTGALVSGVSTDGTATTLDAIGSSQPGFVDGSRHTVGFVWTAVTGATSTHQFRVDGANLGAANTSLPARPTGLYNSTFPITIGMDNNGNSRTTGNIYAMRLYADGNLVASPDFTRMVAGQTTITDAQGNMWTLNGAAKVVPPPSIVLESNFFPTNAETENWRVSAECSGTGRFRVGIVFFQPSMAEEDATYYATPWHTFTSGSASQKDFHRVFASLPTPDTTKEGCVRIEFQGTECWVDEVLAAPEDGPGTYFDAMSPLAQPGDYSWYGDDYGIFGNQSFSLFYNNRAMLDNLMFTYLTQHAPGEPDVIIRGEAFNWVPEGVNVVPHWDDVFSTRVHSWMEDVVIPPKDFTNKNVVTTLTP